MYSSTKRAPHEMQDSIPSPLVLIPPSILYRIKPSCICIHYSADNNYSSSSWGRLAVLLHFLLKLNNSNKTLVMYKLCSGRTQEYITPIISVWDVELFDQIVLLLHNSMNFYNSSAGIMYYSCNIESQLYIRWELLNYLVTATHKKTSTSKG